MNLASDEGRRLGDSIEARAMADMYAAAPSALELRVETIAGTTLLIAPRIPVSYFNRAIGLGVFEPATQAALDAIVERFAAAGAADYWLHLNPVAKPVQLTEWLGARGFAPPPRRTWAKFLRGPEPYAARPSSLSVRQASPHDAAAIAQTVCAAFGMPPALAPWFAALVGRPGWRFVVAEAEGKIAATGAAFIDGETAWLGVGATVAEQRNRGAQTALLAARIALAADLGCTVLATETGESIAGEVNPSLNNIRRAGFVQVCSRANYAPRR
ncbi:MAG TPA: GNAT family N-acetyltransferase [Gammaproteobacteria bacterium]|nr:GNAT family N-acetyltransferase [Gammaproteobacteria bacterium]